jgi:choice-of-anchor B domain-containing protein
MYRSLALLSVVSLAAVALAHDDDPKILHLLPPWSGPGHVPGSVLNNLLATTPGTPGGTMFGLGDETGTGSITFPRKGVQLLSWLPPEWIDPNSRGANDCWGYVSPSGREYAIIGLQMSTAFVEITDPSAPKVVGVIPSTGSLWRDIKTFGTYAYSVTEASVGVQIIDLAQIDSGVVTLANTVTTGGVPATHNAVIDEVSGYLYRAGGGSGRGLRAYDLNADPVNPPFVGQWNGRYVHDAQVVTYTSGPYAGRQIAFCCGGLNNGSTMTGVIVLDVTNKSNMYVRDYGYYSNPAYSHQGWLSPDRQLFYVNDEKDGSGQKTRTIVMDVSDLSNLKHVTSFNSKARAISHNLYTKGNRIFEANYRAGLRVFDSTNPLAPTEIGWFDTWPSDDATRFNGLWSNYPFFPSGVVIGSDLEKGLFVWWIGKALVSFSYPQGKPELAAVAGEKVRVKLKEDTPGDLQVGTERLYYDLGSGVIEAPLTSLGAGLYEAALPELDVGQEIRWFVGARSTNGILWTSPAEAPYSNWWAIGGDGAVSLFDDDIEQDQGWTVGSSTDTALSGVWERGDPPGSAAEPSEDHTPTGTDCWFTEAGAHLTGKTTLTSPLLDMSASARPIVRFWYWLSDGGNFFQDAQNHLTVRISNDNGLTWQKVTKIKVNQIAAGDWIRYSFPYPEGLAVSNAVRLRLEAEDGGPASELEVAVDDVLVLQPWGGCDWQNYCVAAPNSAGSGALMGASGSTSLSANDLVLDVSGLPAGQFGIFFYGSQTTQVPVMDGFLCVGGPLFRYPVQQADPSGNMSLAIDLNTPVAQAGRVFIGSEWNYQLWYRDQAAGGAGSNFSDGLQVRFCP